MLRGTSVALVCTGISTLLANDYVCAYYHAHGGKMGALMTIIKLIALLGMVLIIPSSSEFITQAEEQVNPVEAETVSVTIEEKPATPEKTEKAETVVTWQDNPNNCDRSTQHIAAEPPFKCIDMPIPTKTTNAAPASSGGCEQYRSLLAQYDWNVDTMMYAMKKESSCNPNAVGDNYPINGLHAVSCGLLQVRTLAGRPSCAQLKDPATNIATAYKIWQGQGYRAWTTLH